jgi:hypothetical protein
MTKGDARVPYRDVDSIDRELELLVSVRASILRLGGESSTAVIDDLLDERLAMRGRGDVACASKGQAF